MDNVTKEDEDTSQGIECSDVQTRKKGIKRSTTISCGQNNQPPEKVSGPVLASYGKKVLIVTP